MRVIKWKRGLSVISVSLLEFRRIFRCALYSIFIGLSAFLSGCVYGPPYYGPPPMVHYHPHVYDYYYYPTAQVYFQFTTGIYYYRDGGVWVTSRVLPPHIHLDAANRVRIQVESDRPYLKFDEHNRIYRPVPNYRFDPEKSRKERDANQRWFQDYKKKYPRGGRN